MALGCRGPLLKVVLISFGNQYSVFGDVRVAG